jgi:gamma-glutamyl-gamma-aminobutyrate hydrolase PuuD
MNNIKKIAIVGHFTGENSFGISKPYLFFWQQFGEVSLISPFETHVRDIDLLVMPGGQDVDPYRYLSSEEDTHIYTGSPCMQKERFDRFLLPKYIEVKTPIFGICRGHQSLAVHFGAKLVQHMYHETNPSNDGVKTMHKVETYDFIKHTIPTMHDYNDLNFDVNSRHHQIVKNCPENATVIGRYEGKEKEHWEEGCIEALSYFPDYPAHTVQWHPEDKRDDFSIRLINHLLNLNNE